MICVTESELIWSSESPLSAVAERYEISAAVRLASAVSLNSPMSSSESPEICVDTRAISCVEVKAPIWSAVRALKAVLVRPPIWVVVRAAICVVLSALMAVRLRLTICVGVNALNWVVPIALIWVSESVFIWLDVNARICSVVRDAKKALLSPENCVVVSADSWVVVRAKAWADDRALKCVSLKAAMAPDDRADNSVGGKAET